jgi:adiponectin receptor
MAKKKQQKLASRPSSAESTLVNTPETPSPGPETAESTIEDFALKASHKVKSIVLYPFHEAPSYQQDNHFILSGYRPQFNSFKGCFHSLFYLHNETGTLRRDKLTK